ncbi:helix-turn-helix domain-containing protein [Sphingomonas sp. PB2P12]|uniref:helix-turn-helix domain-containing protein n=1 Tax=Sphingomonas sandaracina TaxID=3096157 RepID=UPI003FA789CD
MGASKYGDRFQRSQHLETGRSKTGAHASSACKQIDAGRLHALRPAAAHSVGALGEIDDRGMRTLGQLMDNERHPLGATIRAARRERGWSQEELAFRADVSQTIISRIERGRKASSISMDKIRGVFLASELSTDKYSVDK